MKFREEIQILNHKEILKIEIKVDNATKKMYVYDFLFKNIRRFIMYACTKKVFF